ncbi:hypothetical protein EYF80_041056 [Liparis tanakae]|uniref:Uncharacterized protein n=1 Tax=Liparis tanakae TaxID=230148 RepID=A0A4Z2G824_9TELE|nr:hypothetical protein EYF80_041056 [Liparis tanakae]
MMGTPRSRWPVSPMASGTEDDSTNSMYAMPFDLREFLSEIILTSLTCSGEEARGRGAAKYATQKKKAKVMGDMSNV